MTIKNNDIIVDSTIVRAISGIVGIGQNLFRSSQIYRQQQQHQQLLNRIGQYYPNYQQQQQQQQPNNNNLQSIMNTGKWLLQRAMQLQNANGAGLGR